MPNGKGTLECCYCTYFQSKSGYEGYDSAYEEGSCNHWKVGIPTALPSWMHRICADFAPNEFYERDNRHMMQYHGWDTAESVKERMSWFSTELKPGVLYVFCYNQPPGIKEIMKLAADESGAAGDE